MLSLLVFLVSGINFAMAEDTPVLTMSLDKTTVAVDKGETITAKWSVSGGTGPYTVRIFWQVEGTIIQWKEQTYGDLSDTFQPTFGSKGKVSINGHDANGKHIYSEYRDFSITGSPQVEAMAVNIEMSNQGYDISKGERATAQVSVTGGKGPYRLHIEWIIKERLENNFLKDYTYYDPFITGFTGTKELSFKPLFGDEGSLRVAATDQDGRNAEKTVVFGLTGSPDALGFVVNLYPQLPSATYDVQVGETVSATWEAQGGVGPYKYSSGWEIVDTPNHWSDEINYVPYSSEHKSASYKPTFGDTGYFSVSAEDSLGRWRWASFEFKIKNASTPEPLKVRALLDRVNVLKRREHTGELDGYRGGG